jgi:hypothetical protein
VGRTRDLGMMTGVGVVFADGYLVDEIGRMILL